MWQKHLRCGHVVQTHRERGVMNYANRWKGLPDESGGEISN